jgi:hypothetical protein
LLPQPQRVLLEIHLAGAMTYAVDTLPAGENGRRAA